MKSTAEMAKLDGLKYPYKSGEREAAGGGRGCRMPLHTCRRKSISEFLRWNPELEVKESFVGRPSSLDGFDDLTWYHFGLK